MYLFQATEIIIIHKLIDQIIHIRLKLKNATDRQKIKFVNSLFGLYVIIDFKLSCLDIKVQ